MDGPDPIGKSRIAISTYTSLTSPESPMSKTPTAPDPLPPVLADGRSGLTLGFRDLPGPSSRDLENSDFPMTDVIKPYID
jgi:hypothetical protein